MNRIQRNRMFLIPVILVLLFMNAGAALAKSKTESITDYIKLTSAFYTHSYFDRLGNSHQELFIAQGIKQDSGITLAWSKDNQTVTLTKGKNILKFVAGQQKAVYNGKALQLGSKVKAVDGGLMVPLGAVAGKLGLNTSKALNYLTYLKVREKAAEEAQLKSLEVTRSGITISTENTDGTMVDLWGNSLKAKELLIKIVKEGGIPRYKVVTPVKNEFEDILMLSDGTGKYFISVYDNATLKPLLPNSENLFTVKVTNTSTPYMDYTYLLPTKNVESKNPKIIMLAKQITAGLQDDLAKTKAIHDWVSTNIAYDVEGLNAANKTTYSAVQILERKMGICDGYSKLTAALNRAAGIPAKIIWGMAYSALGDNKPTGYIAATDYNHAWVETKINGRWLIQDTTWDAGYVSGNSFTPQLTQDYFDPDPEQFFADHSAAFVFYDDY